MPASLKLLKESLEHGHKSYVKYIFAKWSEDGLYYQAKLLECDIPKKQCLLRFQDGTEHWMNSADIHAQLNLERLPQEKIVCSQCDNGDSKPPNEIVICEICEQGYHQRCHVPHIDSAIIDAPGIEEVEIHWQCSTCSYINQQQQQQQQQQQPPQQSQQRQKHKQATTPGPDNVTAAEGDKKPLRRKGKRVRSIVIGLTKPKRAGRRPAYTQEEDAAATTKTSSKASATTKGKDLDKTQKKIDIANKDKTTDLKKLIPESKNFEGENNPYLSAN